MVDHLYPGVVAARFQSMPSLARLATINNVPPAHGLVERLQKTARIDTLGSQVEFGTPAGGSQLVGKGVRVMTDWLRLGQT